jgi:type III secretion protein R
MMMVSPLAISVPFKLFLFVMVDGWSRLLHGLILSYSS